MCCGKVECVFMERVHFWQECVLFHAGLCSVGWRVLFWPKLCVVGWNVSCWHECVLMQD